MNWPWILQAAGVIVLLAAALTAITKGVRWLIATLRKVNEFLEDWRGEAARHGRAAVPGVMERLVILEEHAKTVAHEVRPNSGTSLKDQITRIEEKMVPPEDRPPEARPKE